MPILIWPEETICSSAGFPKWSHPGSNLCLDFHGDPTAARLMVFSDGNHHMALLEALQRFSENNLEANPIFFATLPPGPVLQWIRQGVLQIGNLILSAKPHVFIGPPQVLDLLVREGYLLRHQPFVRNRGSVLLVRKGNPRNILGVGDLSRKDVRLFLSNPTTEAVSHKGYTDTLRGLAAREGVHLPFLKNEACEGVVYGERIHHREAPQAIADGQADVAIVYYHLALRYSRIFPSMFEIVPLGGTAGDPQPTSENIIGITHVGLIGDGGLWGKSFVQFLSSKPVRDIYTYHGLQPVCG